LALGNTSFFGGTGAATIAHLGGSVDAKGSQANKRIAAAGISSRALRIYDRVQQLIPNEP
jgi:hypothetical protein